MIARSESLCLKMLAAQLFTLHHAHSRRECSRRQVAIAHDDGGANATSNVNELRRGGSAVHKSRAQHGEVRHHPGGAVSATEQHARVLRRGGAQECHQGTNFATHLTVGQVIDAKRTGAAWIRVYLAEAGTSREGIECSSDDRGSGGRERGGALNACRIIQHGNRHHGMATLCDVMSERRMRAPRGKECTRTLCVPSSA